MIDSQQVPRIRLALAAFLCVLLCGALPHLSSCRRTEQARQTGGAERPTEETGQWRLSNECAQAAERFWERSVFYEPPGPRVSGYVYTSHYNRQMRKCLVRLTSGPQAGGGDLGFHEKIYDAVEGTRIASVDTTTKDVLLHPKREVAIMNYLGSDLEGVSLPDTPENREWFDHLMER